MTSINFGSTPSINSISTTDYPKVPNCLTGTPSADCDEAIGDIYTTNTFCSDPAYQYTTFCACVNNSVPCPQTTMAACANTAYAYKPYAWTQSINGGPSQDDECKAINNCVNILEAGGTSNLVSGVSQVCGSTAPNSSVYNTLFSNPAVSLSLLFMIILLCIVIFIHTEDVELDLLSRVNGSSNSSSGQA